MAGSFILCPASVTTSTITFHGAFVATSSGSFETLSINFLCSILFSCSVFILLSMKNNAKRTQLYNNCTCDLLIFSLRCLLPYLLIELNYSANVSGSILQDPGVLFLDLIIISAPELSKLVKNKAVIFSSSSPSSHRFLTTEGVKTR